jgi:hypothetical protein
MPLLQKRMETLDCTNQRYFLALEPKKWPVRACQTKSVDCELTARTEFVVKLLTIGNESTSIAADQSFLGNV